MNANKPAEFFADIESRLEDLLAEAEMAETVFSPLIAADEMKKFNMGCLITELKSVTSTAAVLKSRFEKGDA